MVGPTVNLAALRDRLSEFLEVERLLVDHYGRLERQALSEALRSQVRVCRAETKEHVGMLAEILAGLGGEPACRSTEALAAASRLRSLDEVHLRGLAATGELLESLFLLELKSQLDWQLLQQIGQATGLSGLLDACAAVRPAKDDRVRWLGQQIRRIAAHELAAPTLISSRAAALEHEAPPPTSA